MTGQAATQFFAVIKFALTCSGFAWLEVALRKKKIRPTDDGQAYLVSTATPSFCYGQQFTVVWFIIMA